jgi:hypothetical protein
MRRPDEPARLVEKQLVVAMSASRALLTLSRVMTELWAASNIRGVPNNISGVPLTN